MPSSKRHLLHSFCSHLAMRAAPALSIQKLAGHQNLQTTLRYMHLSPGETDRAIRLLEGADSASEHAESDRKSGDNRETTTNVITFPRHHE